MQGDPEAAGPLGFCGTLGVREEAGGLLDMRARLYDPALGRFTSPDPWPAYLPEPTTLNRYLYGLGDGLDRVDFGALLAQRVERDPRGPSSLSASLRGEEFSEGVAEVGGFAGSSVAVAGLEGSVDGAEDEGAFGVWLASLVGGEPGFDF